MFFCHCNYCHHVLGEVKAIGGRIILKQILNIYGVRMWSELSLLIIKFNAQTFKFYKHVNNLNCPLDFQFLEIVFTLQTPCSTPSALNSVQQYYVLI